MALVPLWSFAVTRLLLATFVVLALAPDVRAQKLVDPSTVAPEFREAAEKRRAEQIRQQNCAQKATQEKVLPRERIAFIAHCLDEEVAKSP
jgi:hypothetical protein